MTDFLGFGSSRDPKGRPGGARRLAELASLGLVLPSSIVVGLFLGWLLDRWLGTAPWLLIVFTLFGVASGLLSLFRGLRKIEAEEDRDRGNGT